MCDFGDVLGYSDPAAGALFGGDGSPDPTQEQIIASMVGDKYVQAISTLRAQNQIYPDVMDLTRRAATDYGDLFRSEAEKTRGAELEAFRKYAPEYVEAIGSADPEQQKLLQLLMDTTGLDIESATRFLRSTEEELGYGSELSPRMRRDVQQGVRAGQASRGLGFGPSDTFEEALASVLEGENLLERRQDRYKGAIDTLLRTKASGIGVSGARQRVIGDPFLAATGRPALPQGSNILAPNFGGFQDDLFTYGVNRETQSRDLEEARRASRDALIGAGIQAFGSLAGGAAGGLI